MMTAAPRQLPAPPAPPAGGGKGGASKILFFLLFFAVCVAWAASLQAANPEPLKFSELYSGASPLGLVLSPKLQSLEGKMVIMEGFMAPPLKPTLRFFVLTRAPMSICPFCSSDSDWPYDIVVVRLQEKITALPFDRPVRVVGRLELGSKTDEESGFVSLVRIDAVRVQEAD